MSDLVPDAEAKPSIPPQTHALAFNALTGALVEAGRFVVLSEREVATRAVLDAVGPILMAAGRSQAAADVRAEMAAAPIVKPLTPGLAAELVEYCAQLAEGSGRG